MRIGQYFLKKMPELISRRQMVRQLWQHLLDLKFRRRAEFKAALRNQANRAE